MRGRLKGRRQMLDYRLASAGNSPCQRCERPLKQLPDTLIIGSFGQYLMAGKNPSRISVHHEDRMITSVKQDGIRSFRPDAVQAEKFLPELVSGAPKQFRQGAFVMPIQIRDEKFQPPGFLAKITSGTNQPLEVGQRYLADSLGAEQMRRAKIRQSFFYVRPRRVLREVSAHDYFQARLCRPPMLRPRGAE